MIKVSNDCIGCGVCGMTAPTIFKVEGAPATVLKQPETPEEEKLCAQAIESCPVHAISNEEDMKMAA